MASARRPVLGKDQITQYFERIKLPEGQRRYCIAGMGSDEALEYLALLQKHHLAEIPFENITLHYSHHRQISIHPEELFKKIVSDNNNRGGYCMENNTLLNMLLRSLGFKIYSAGGRVFDGGAWTGWSHMVNMVTIGDSRYHVDVGFGGPGPVRPLKLDRAGTTMDHIQPASMRLQWRNIEGNTDESQRLWVYEHRISESGEFTQIYCFSELEFLPVDYLYMNYYTSTSPRTFFTQTVVGEKKILGGENNSELVGSLILGNNDLKWRIRGEKEREIHFENEEDRIKALEEHWGIKLSQLERDSVRGLTSEIKS
ncbi:arylamine N-acetyltransferase 1 [Clohesyomyces aquaticus]|uniref:Arylamine N-acetyltransferase 1 n=1 Tax=Clohesyomyces aquaticus TaxID=1231657 RepID=A0A1Y1ZED0_9PLEO|nr:arylamine N-acetyltransferase 1 [Clohesyomyces aquaticus]